MKTIIALAACFVAMPGWAEDKVIPGLPATYFDDALKKEGFVMKETGGSAQVERTWKLSANTTDFNVTVFSPASTPGAVISISATVVNTDEDSSRSTEIAEPFFGWLATLEYTGCNPTEAKLWVKSNVGNRTERVLGPVKFQLFGSETRARTMRISTEPLNPEEITVKSYSGPAITHLDPKARGKNAKIPELGALYADVEKDNGKPVIRDPDTGWATWPTFKVHFIDGRAAEVVKR
ncbi:hypothetical protein [Prosthecobacter sp.]|uniref:hypothetical protein n=1 Tax=Prosthecobacter sp. TaxID=1965333 RepID=UPI003784E293